MHALSKNSSPYTYAPSHIGLASNEAGLVDAQAEQKKNRKYAELLLSHHFTPIAIETGGVFGPEGTAFLRDLGQCLCSQSGDPLSYCYPEQQIAVAIQRATRQ